MLDGVIAVVLGNADCHDAGPLPACEDVVAAARMRFTHIMIQP